MRQHRLCAAVQFGDDAVGQSLSQFDAPLVETVDPPDCALSENAVLVQRDEAAERRGIVRVPATWSLP